ncbi:MAG: SDR family NAD(P)-dependent oxidoreductase [Thermoleophilaceae bacterium]
MQTAVVTGAGRGIGREVARRLAQRGYAVLVTDVDEAGAQATADEIGGGAWAMAQDVREADSHRAAAKAATERGPLKVWVNNAGVMSNRNAWDHDDAEVKLHVDVNFYGVLWGSRAAVDAMRADPHDAHIINMASMSSFGPVPGLAVYGATKHAVLGFSESLGGDLHLADIPITVHAICPDTVDTGLVRENADRPEAALVFSAPRILSPDAVADRIVGVLDSGKLVLAIPGWRRFFAESTGWFPRLSLRLVRPIVNSGERKRQKAQTTGRL